MRINPITKRGQLLCVTKNMLRRIFGKAFEKVYILDKVDVSVKKWGHWLDF